MIILPIIIICIVFHLKIGYKIFDKYAIKLAEWLTETKLKESKQ